MNSNSKIEKAHRTLLMIGMFSIVMLFAGLTSAYIVSKGSLGTKWDVINLPFMFYISTLMILISSYFGYSATKNVLSDKTDALSKSLFITIIFGVLFFIFQILGWNALTIQGKFLSGNNVASSYLYVLTFAHLLHLIGGLIALIVVYAKSIQKKYSSENYNSLLIAVRFWHFLAILWVYLILFILFIN